MQWYTKSVEVRASNPISVPKNVFILKKVVVLPIAFNLICPLWVASLGSKIPYFKNPSSSSNRLYTR